MFEVFGFAGGLLGNSTCRTEDRVVNGAACGNTQRTMGFDAPQASSNKTHTNAHGFIRYDLLPANIFKDGMARLPTQKNSCIAGLWPHN